MNILLWVYKSWALTIKLGKKLEVCHNRFLRRMVKITIYDVMENRIRNETVREELGNCRTLHQIMELKRSKWLRKLATSGYGRNPRSLIKAWRYKKPRPRGNPQHTIKKSLSDTLINSLGLSDEINDWIKFFKQSDWNKECTKRLNLTVSYQS